MSYLLNKWSLISRYLAGECSDRETKEIEEWIHANPSRREEMDYLQKVWNAFDNLETEAGSKGQDKEKEAQWEKLAKKLHAHDVSSSTEYASTRTKKIPSTLYLKKFRKYSNLGSYLRVAAVIILIFGSGVLISQLYTADTSKYDYVETRLFEFSTTTSQLAGVELLDGSKINLSVKSSIHLSDNFYQENREVYLNGHAYFDVISDPSSPFIVQTSTAVVKALGTDFTVKDYPGDERVQVVVMNGTVSFEQNSTPDNSEILVYSGERALLNTTTGEITKTKVNTTNYLEWIEGRIVFEENTLAEATRELERWFGIDFVINNLSLHEKKITAVLDSKSLSNVLEVLGQTMDVNYHLEDNRVVISERM